MATVTGLNLKEGRWHLCIIIPQDLRAVYGKAKVNRALGTSDKAEANRRGLRKRAEWFEEFETKRKALNAQGLEVITPELAQVLADGARKKVLQADQSRREGNDTALRALSLVGLPLMRDTDGSIPLPDRKPLEGLSDWELNALTTLNATESKTAGRALAGQNLLTALPLLQADAQAMGFTVTEQIEGLKEALQAYLRSYRQARQEATQRDAGELLSTDSSLPPPGLPGAPTGLTGSLLAQEPILRPTAAQSAAGLTSLRDILSQWLEADPKSRDTEQAASRALSLAEECLGSLLYVQQVTRAQGNTFKAWLQHPDRHTQPKTAKDRLMYVNALLAFATQEPEVIPKNPWQGLHIVVPEEVTRVPWTDQQLQTLFSQPLHQSYAIPPEERSGGGPAAYWIPIIGIYTGARIGELAQLRVSDITETDGIPVIRITDEGEGQRVKTTGSRRSLPIHSELIRLGLLDYAEGLRQENPDGSLWPLLQTPKLMSAWFGRYRKSIPGLEGKWLDFHSLRHTVRTRLAKAGVAEKTIDAITGHVDGGSTGRRVYTHLDMEDLQQAIEQLSYDSVSFPRVYRLPSNSRQ